jgi:chitodextrinase
MQLRQNKDSNNNAVITSGHTEPHVPFRVSSLWGYNPLVLAIFLLIFGGGSLYVIATGAARAPPTIYLTPASQTFKAGATFSVQVRENSGTTGVNAVQANLSYPSNLLTCTGIDATSTAFGVEAQSTCSAGQITIARGISGGSSSLTGDQLVAVVNFTVGSTGGSAAMAFTSGTALVSASTNQDILGSLAVTGGATFTIDITSPTVSISAPASGASVGGSAVTVMASASDNVALEGVQFKLDGVNLGAEDITSPYSVNWNSTTATNGSHTLTAVATDTAGNTTTTSGTIVTVDNSPPTISMSAPANGSTVSGSSVTISASASDNNAVAGVQFNLDGVNLNAEDTTSPYSIAWNSTTATNGSHTLRAVARDAAGNLTTSASITVTVDNAAPAVSITTPVVSASVAGSAVTVTASASDNVGVVGVQFKLDGVNLGAEDITSPYSVNWNSTTATNGSHTLTAVARDAAGNTTTSSAVTVTVDNAAPTVSITAPTAGATIIGSTTITASAADNTGGSGVAKVEFYIDSTLVSTDTTSPYNFNWDPTSYPNGAHTISAKAYDNVSPANIASSTSVSIMLALPDIQPPTVPANLSVSSRTTTSITLTWSASTDNIGVTGYKVMRGGALVANVNGLTYSDTGLASSTTYSYTISAVDAAGNTSAASTAVTTATLTPVAGDCNDDSHVGVIDLSLLLSNYATSYRPCDFNGDNIVNIFDLSVLLSNYGI